MVLQSTLVANVIKAKNSFTSLCPHSLGIYSFSALGSGPSLATTWTRSSSAVGHAGEPGRKWEGASPGNDPIWIHTLVLIPGCVSVMSFSKCTQASVSEASLLKFIRAPPDAFWPWSSCLDVFFLAWWVWIYLGQAWYIWTQATVFELECRLAPTKASAHSRSHRHKHQMLHSLLVSPTFSLSYDPSAICWNMHNHWGSANLGWAWDADTVEICGIPLMSTHRYLHFLLLGY